MKTHYCNECSKNKKVEYFSKTQLKRGSLCRCKSCIDESNVSASTSSSQKEGSLNNDSNFAREWSKEKLIFEIARNTDLELLHTESRYELIPIYNTNVRNENEMKELTLNNIGSIANEKQVRAVKRKKTTVENLSKRTNKVRSEKTAGEKKRRRIPTDEPDTDDIPLTTIKMEPPPLDRFNDDSDNYFDWSPNKLRQMTGVHDTNDKHYSIFYLQNIYTNIRNSMLMDTEDFSSDDSSDDSSEDSSEDSSSSDDSVHSTKDSDSIVDVKLLTTVTLKIGKENLRLLKSMLK